MLKHSRIDVVIYNSGAIHWGPILDITLKKHDIMHSVNLCGFYAEVQAVMPSMISQKSGRIDLISPPVYSRFLQGKIQYALSKLSMSLLVGDGVGDGAPGRYRCLLDEDYLRECGVTAYTRYLCSKDSEPPRMMPRLFPDLTVAEQDDRGFTVKSRL